MTTSVVVATADPLVRAPILRAAGAGPDPLPEHSGQRTPTAACVMHEVQIGRSHDEHERSVSRSGCR